MWSVFPTLVTQMSSLQFLALIHCIFSNPLPNRTLFASSVLNLSELVALRPDLAKLHKILYFHENQLVYPVRKQQERDFQHGYSQILSWSVAALTDIVCIASVFGLLGELWVVTGVSVRPACMGMHKPW